MTKHKHYDCIVAWAEGAKIETLSLNKWYGVDNPTWNEELEYRIKKEPVIEVKYYIRGIDSNNNISLFEFTPSIAAQWHLKITYQDGKAIKAELPNEEK